ncbi:hypothetical protein C8J56DRAFT_860805 [Mycena floridula]|nr:hypothetical protein C8J56DRAFT_860805 [Mycena floridula]
MYSLLFLLLTSASVALSEITIGVPESAQLPRVARVQKPYTWSVPEKTFSGCDYIKYSVPSKPQWLSFDSTTKTFTGNPSNEDIGATDVVMAAQGCNSSKSISLSILVTDQPPPKPRISIQDQFHSTNPSLSSVFLVTDNSALSTGNPALFSHRRWSWSIGFDYGMYEAENVYYEVRQADGTGIPDWMDFNPHTVTLNGVCPHDINAPYRISLLLFSSGTVGYFDAVVSFDFWVADSQLELKEKLPTLNVTAGTDFLFTLSSIVLPALVVDGQPLQSTDITNISLPDVFHYPWLTYNSNTRTLSGTSPSPVTDANRLNELDIIVGTSFNQSIVSVFNMAVVPSYFYSSEQRPLDVVEGSKIQYDLTPAICSGTHAESVNATWNPKQLGETLQFDSERHMVTGYVSKESCNDKSTIVFDAYDSLTNSMSQTTLPISCTPLEKSTYDAGGNNGNRAMSKSSRKRLVLGLGISFGIIGTLGVLAALLAAFRTVARVEDTAVEGEAGQSAFSDKDKRWYGLPNNATDETGYGWTGDRDIEKNQGLNYGDLGLRRVMERSQSSQAVGSPGVMSKREFVTKLKETVRNVSDKYKRVKRSSLNTARPFIGKPILIVPGSSSSYQDPASPSRSDPFIDSETPRSSVRAPAAVHFADTLSRQESTESISSVQADAEEATVHTASRATSVHSRRTASEVSIALSEPVPSLPVHRPTLVPFTSASRVPVPQLSVNSGGYPDNRVNSQSALPVWSDEEGVQKADSGDELSMGLHYVRTLGAENTAPSSLTVSTNVRSSFSSLESSNHGHSNHITRMLVRTGEQFKFRVAVRSEPGMEEKSRLYARQISGNPLPGNIHVDVNCRYPGSVEFYGVPLGSDIGEMEIGLYTPTGICECRVLLEIVSRT